MNMRNTLTGVGALALVATLAACGSGGSADPNEGDTGSGDNGTTEVTVGMIPTSSFAGVFVAQDQGFFEEAGLDVTVSVVSNAASIVPAVLNGQMQFGTVATPPFLSAIDKGLAITGIAPTTGVTTDPEKDTGCIMVSSGSDITSVDDLVGKTVATNQIGSLPHVAATALLGNAGVDVDAVDYAPMPFPDMVGALEQGRVDALLVVEPFRSTGLESGNAECMSGLYTSAYDQEPTDTMLVASDRLIESDPDIVDSFAEAIAQANQAMSDDPQLARDALVEHGNLDAAVAEALVLPMYATAFNVEGTQAMADQALDDGFLDAAVDVASVIRTD